MSPPSMPCSVVLERHSSLDPRGHHSPASQGAGIPALRDAVAPGSGAVRNPNCPGTSRCCVTVTAGGRVMLVTMTSATATGWVPRKIAEMLRWCQEAGIEMATVYLLSTENLQRDPDELSTLIEIITDVVEEICAPANRWSVRTVGDLELLGEEPARRLREAVESTNGNGSGFPCQRRGRIRRPPGDRRRRAGAARQGTGQRRDRRPADRGRHRSTPSRRTSTPPGSPTPTW